VSGVRGGIQDIVYGFGGQFLVFPASGTQTGREAIKKLKVKIDPTMFMKKQERQT
jgi:hypothetical protein